MTRRTHSALNLRPCVEMKNTVVLSKTDACRPAAVAHTCVHVYLNHYRKFVCCYATQWSLLDNMLCATPCRMLLLVGTAHKSMAHGETTCQYSQTVPHRTMLGHRGRSKAKRSSPTKGTASDVLVRLLGCNRIKPTI
jgi:hypothetical protein